MEADAKEGCDPQFGARPLKHAIQEQILNPLSVRLLEGEFKPGLSRRSVREGGAIKSRSRPKVMNWFLRRDKRTDAEENTLSASTGERVRVKCRI
jgi:hypothetical protein